MSYLVFARKAGQSWKGGWHDFVGQFERLSDISTLEYEEWTFLDLKYDVPKGTYFLTFRWGSMERQGGCYDEYSKAASWTEALEVTREWGHWQIVSLATLRVIGEGYNP